MTTFVRGIVLAGLLAPAGWTQSLTHVRLTTPGAAALAEQLELEGFDVVEGSVAADEFELVVSPASQALLEARGWVLETLAVGRPYYDIQRELLAASPDAPPAGYSDLNGVYARMNAFAAAHPSRALVVDLTVKYGTPVTAEGRHLFALKVSDNVALDEDEPNMLLVAEYHAREIVTPEIVLTAAGKLLDGYAGNAAIQAAVDGYEIWLAPVWNPDGYNYVFTSDNFWRKNRRNNGGGQFGVDQNRNHTFEWGGPCSGSTSTSSDTYKGPFAGSEPETQTMMAFSLDRRFAKVIDYHSFGSEVLWAYTICLNHIFGTSYLRPEAIALSVASGYGGAERPPTADGEHYEWQLANFTNWAFLIETHTDFQPSFASAQAEANQLWGGILFGLQRPIPLWGHVTDAGSGTPLDATVRFLNLNWQHGEVNSSGGAFGRYYGVVPAGNYSVEVSAPCYQTQVAQVTVIAGSSVQKHFALQPMATPTTYCTSKVNSQGCAGPIASTGTPSASAGSGFVITASQIIPSAIGVFFYSKTGPAAVPFQGGWLCLAGQVTRTAGQSSGGAGNCGGNFAFDFNAYLASGGDPALVSGSPVWGQYWSRDPSSPSATHLTNAIAFTLCP
jgi:hypothetical protein